MRRLHIFEFEDLPWLPHSLRSLLTQVLQRMNNSLGVYESVAPLLSRTLERAASTRIVDLCSGAGGPWPSLCTRLADQVPELRITLTDRYPQPRSASVWASGSGFVSYCEDPVDATKVPATLVGVRTMFTGFHHFERSQATQILGDSVAQRAPIALFEFTRRHPLNVLLAVVAGGLGLPLVVPWLRPLRWTHLFWTYVVPIAPLLYAWDGAVSNVRTYTPDELRAMAAEVDDGTYTWEIGQLSVPRAPGPITYLIGHPPRPGVS